MRIVSMAVAALIAMTATALAGDGQQSSTRPKALYKFQEYVKADGWMVASPYELDSPCVGDVSTPKCSVETLIACFVSNTDEWCTKAMGEPPTFSSILPIYEFQLYRFLLIEPIRKARYFQEPENGGSGGAHGTQTQAGDFHVVVLRRECFGAFQRQGKNVCRKREYTTHYFTRQREDGSWTTFGWFSSFPGMAKL